MHKGSFCFEFKWEKKAHALSHGIINNILEFLINIFELFRYDLFWVYFINIEGTSGLATWYMDDIRSSLQMNAIIGQRKRIGRDEMRGMHGAREECVELW